MQHERKSPRRGVNSCIAALLAVLLLVFGLLAASGSWHQSLHHDNPAGTDFCAVCLFAKGQVDLPDATPAPVAAVLLPLSSLLAASASVPSQTDFLLPPERAPPGRSHHS